ncbi:hypothetical protein D3C73_1038190 [compost metagenome]
MGDEFFQICRIPGSLIHIQVGRHDTGFSPSQRTELIVAVLKPVSVGPQLVNIVKRTTVLKGTGILQADIIHIIRTQLGGIGSKANIIDG